MDITVRRLTQGDVKEAREAFALMADVFQEKHECLSDEYITALLGCSGFWAMCAFSGMEVLAGLTAHTLPMTNRETSEVLLYDIAVVPEHRRKGIGRRLLEELLSLTSREGCSVVFVLADDADQEALDFYRKVGAEATKVTLFSYSSGLTVAETSPDRRRCVDQFHRAGTSRPGLKLP